MKRLIACVLALGLALPATGCVAYPARPGWCYHHPYRCRWPVPAPGAMVARVPLLRQLGAREACWHCAPNSPPNSSACVKWA